MLKLFDPQSKVQKDRKIIRETDMRMAKYSRRGLISNFLIYTICLALEGTFISQHHSIAIVLTSGLLLVTLVRGYFLFRIDAIYPRGPAAWRTKYFLATLAGASWWGVILGYITLYMDMRGEASLMWLYTVVFFSTTAHAFAPYKRFLSVYQFLGLVPASLCTFFIGDYIGPFYGFILLSFYIILNYHCSLMSLNYWERLEAQYILAKKSVSLEEEKRDTRASVQLTNEYIQLLSVKMDKILRRGKLPQDDPLAILSQNVSDFRSVVAKEVETKSGLFNVRHLLQYRVRAVVDAAEVRGLELETYLSPALPSRMIGDSQLISRVVSIILNSSLQYAKNCALLLNVEFIREYERSGELLITVSRQSQTAKRSIFQSEEALLIPLNLDLVLAKGLAETLNGSLQIDESGGNDGRYMQLRCPLIVAEPGARPEYHRLAYKGRPILLVHSSSGWLNNKCLELEAMGFDVKTETDLKDAIHTLKGALATSKAIQSVVYTTSLGTESSIQFCNDILEHTELKYMHQFVVCSQSGHDFFSKRVIRQSPLIHYVGRPAGFFEFETCFNSVFENETINYLNTNEIDSSGASVKSNHVLWVSLIQDINHSAQFESESNHIEFVSDIKSVMRALEQSEIQMAVVECCDDESIYCIQRVREEEARLGRDAFLPIVAFGPRSCEERALEVGADHFFDEKVFLAADLPSLAFWLKGGHH